MATLLLSAAGAALGGGLGGSFIGIGTAALGKAIGATVGSLVDQKLMGVGSEPVETGRVERFRVMGSSEGAALPRIWGRARVAGQIIWSSRFLEHVNSSEVGGKGGGGTTVREYSYTVSLAIALCEGSVVRVGRIWADGQTLDQRGLTWRLHRGDEDQIPDPLIAAIEGADAAPAYRGTAYIVFESLDLTPFGNRIPQFNFEVFRRPKVHEIDVPVHPADQIQAVALVPGTGEYSLATEPVTFKRGKGQNTVVNVHNDLGVPDIVASLQHLQHEVPRAGSVSLVVSWFGSDLRVGRCTLRPKVEQQIEEGDSIAWSVDGVRRTDAERVSLLDGRPLFGGTPADATVVQAIRHMRAIGIEVMFYPFILMDILSGNGLPDPWSGHASQPVVPWRGRITLDAAPGRSGSSDRTSAAAAEVAAFIGTAQPSDFEVLGSEVRYSGPAEWSYRRFILHYAHLCASAGGVKAFCIGSELRGLTQIRDGAASYPFVRALCDLAADVRSILGAQCCIGYAADWSEYFGHQPADGSGDVIFNLDPLWANDAIDFVGIDNYMPLSDWRDGHKHADSSVGSIYSLEYLRGNVAGGEGFDWYYASNADRDAQNRTVIRDGAHGEDWIFRYKDIKSWWSEPHRNRIGGVRENSSTEWVPQSKPIWFTELGCPAVDKGTNQPNVFHDPKSSESFFPYYSSGGQDIFIQIRYLQATYAYWQDEANNPRSTVYDGRMLDLKNAYVWAWDARPWPDFPSRIDTWIDGGNYALGHWINGRTCSSPLASIVAEVAEDCRLTDVDVISLDGVATGYSVEALSTGRQAIQPLMIAYGFDGHSVDGKVSFRTRGGQISHTVAKNTCVVKGNEPVLSHTRAPLAETPGSVTFGFVNGDIDYATSAVSSSLPDTSHLNATQTSYPLVLAEAEAKAIADRWLSESLVARDMVELTLSPSKMELMAGDAIEIQSGGRHDVMRIDRVEEQGARSVRAVRIDTTLYSVPVVPATPVAGNSVLSPSSVYAEFLDLPLLTGSENPYAPHVAMTQQPWAGPVALYSASDDYGYRLNVEVRKAAVMGDVLEAVPKGVSGVWMNCTFRVRLASGSLQSRSAADVLNGANVAAIRGGGGADWEVIQFQRAELIAPLEYRLSGILRGQAGTDAVMDAIPDGADFVLLDGAVSQIEMGSSARGLERHYRYGPARLSYDDPSYQHLVGAFDGVGLRPYSPVHLKAERQASGDVVVSWIRRSRLDGDSWQGSEVPIGEDRELYHVRVMIGPNAVREETTASPVYRYSTTLQAVDGNSLTPAFEVAQISDRFGPGPYTRIVL